MKVRHEGKQKMKQFENKASEMLNGNLIIWIKYRWRSKYRWSIEKWISRKLMRSIF